MLASRCRRIRAASEDARPLEQRVPAVLRRHRPLGRAPDGRSTVQGASYYGDLMPAGTLDEKTSQAEERVRLLTFVLHYDDLLAADSATYVLSGIGPRLLVGRNEAPPHGLRGEGELRLYDAWVSSRHALFDLRGDTVRLTDCDSRNGTYVNGVKIDERELADGDLIEIGHSLLCYREVTARLASALGAGAPRLGPTATFCPEVAALDRDLSKIAPTRESVLILAETGAGKEIVAEAVHARSGRRGALRTVDCGAVPESLFEATFFGHRRGAFTGASEARTGEILRARDGTLFLDEVANMSPACQAKLLRVLEDGRVTPIGGAEQELCDLRWIAATNRDLLDDPGSFRPDLLRRLTGYVARLPPLRRRREDLGSLTAHCLKQAGVERAAITAAAGRQLFCGALPGNIRQLRAALRTAAALASGQPIDVFHLPPLGGPGAGAPDAPAADEDPAPTGEAPARRKRTAPTAAAIENALQKTGGNVVQAAQVLATHPRQLYRLIDRLAIPLDRYRA